MTRPIFPYTPGQGFKNLTYRKVQPPFAERRTFLKKVLGVNCSTPHLVSHHSINAIRLEDNTGCSSPSISEQVLGYPPDQAASNKLMEMLVPDGFYRSNKFKDSIFASIESVKFFEWSFLEPYECKRHVLQRVHEGSCVSLGEGEYYFERESGSPVQNTNVYRPVVGGNGVFNIGRSCAKTDIVNMADIFVPARNFTAEIGLVLLPENSLVWVWKKDKWTPGWVSALNSTDDTVELKVFELKSEVWGNRDDKTLLYKVSGTELEVHKAIARMIRLDNIRIAVRNLSCAWRARHTDQCRLTPETISMFLNDYNAPVLDVFKLRLLKSTEFTNLTNFMSFVQAVNKRTPCIDALMPMSSYGADLCKWTCLAAQNGTPFLWGYHELLQSMCDRAAIQEGSNMLTHIGLRSSGPAASVATTSVVEALGIDPKEVGNQGVPYEVDCRVRQEEVVCRSTVAQPTEPITIRIPTIIQSSGNDVIKSYIRRKLSNMFQEGSEISRSALKLAPSEPTVDVPPDNVMVHIMPKSIKIKKKEKA